MFRPLAAATVVIALAGCASQDKVSLIDSTVARGVVAAEQTLTALETAALRYTSLPNCLTVSAVTPCADAGIKTQIKAADQKAYDAVMSARNNQGTLSGALVAIDALRAAMPATVTIQ